MAEQTADGVQQRIDNYVKENMQDEMAAEMKRANDVAKLVIGFSQDGQGNNLANIHTSEGFQSVWDYRGGEKIRFRLDRKREQVAHNYDAKT